MNIVLAYNIESLRKNSRVRKETFTEKPTLQNKKPAIFNKRKVATACQNEAVYFPQELLLFRYYPSINSTPFFRATPFCDNFHNPFKDLLSFFFHLRKHYILIIKEKKNLPSHYI